ncbi:MAG: ATP-dependent DNA helicase RecG [Patescibacteria group bacterium]
MNLATSVSSLTRVGASASKRLNRLGIKTAEDLLFWFPFRYEDYSRIVPIKDLHDGEAVTIRAKLELIASKRSFRKRVNITEALFSDESGSVRATWFNQPFIAKVLQPGDVVFLSGKVKADMLGPQFSSPTYEKETTRATAHTARLVPIYPLTEGLTQKQIRFLIQQVIPLADKIDEWLPENILDDYDLATLSDAIRGIHFPNDVNELRISTERLKFDELFLVQLKAELSRRVRLDSNSTEIIFHEKEVKEFVSGLPFKLTPSQKMSAWEILRDTQKSAPMNRLLSGDVGSGKTIVAAIVAYNTALAGKQTVIMAPTEILAAQHYATINKFLGDKLTMALLTRSQYSLSLAEKLTPSDRDFAPPEGGSSMAVRSKFLPLATTKKRVIEAIKNDEVKIIIGTHALLGEKIEFNDVGLIVVDEQHRFGVAQRKAIKDKTEKIDAHYLSMTATPIPRSLALALFGDLDVSRLTEMPNDRKPIMTRFVEPKNRDKAYDFIRAQVKQGRQVFVVCPLIEEQEKKKKSSDEIEIINYPLGNVSVNDERKSVLSEYKKLSEKVFPDLKVEFLHGKMKPAEKEAVMNRFQNKQTDILVSTSVIEVGIDIPNATVMMIEGADRFGLAQLHQFRGRVGRSMHQSYCFVFTDSPTEKVKERLEFFEKHLDGFKLAERDLETRGPGEVFGAAQSGMMRFRLAKLTDGEIIKKSRDAAVAIAPNIKMYPSLLAKLTNWEDVAHLE